MRRAIDRVRRYREAVGDDVDLCIEIHRRLTPHEAIVLARGIEQYHPFFYEDPVGPDNLDIMQQVADHIDIPIATGERLHTPQEFEMLLSRRAVNYVRPDVCLCGGITGAKKIAALAEARSVGVVPHNPLGPISTAACLQISACIPNFALQEYPRGETVPPKSDFVREPLQREGGYLIIPTKPGIGIELDFEGLKKHPYAPRVMVTRLHEDGSIVDQ
jgi:galactonate dehydratase